MLYVGTGDAGQPALAESATSLAGKVLRVTAIGRPAPGNPDPTSPIFTRGHQVVDGLRLDAAGDVVEVEPGPNNSATEVNVLHAGADYGYPSQAAGARAPDARLPDGRTGVGGCAGIGPQLFVTSRDATALLTAAVTTRAGSSSIGSFSTVLEGRYGRLLTVVAAPDGALWLTTANRDGHGHPVPADERCAHQAVRWRLITGLSHRLRRRSETASPAPASTRAPRPNQSHRAVPAVVDRWVAVPVASVRTASGSLAAVVGAGVPDRVGRGGIGTAYTVDPAPSESTRMAPSPARPRPRRTVARAARGAPASHESVAAMSPTGHGPQVGVWEYVRTASTCPSADMAAPVAVSWPIADGPAGVPVIENRISATWAQRLALASDRPSPDGVRPPTRRRTISSPRSRLRPERPLMPRRSAGPPG